jgi:hypothetical protein
MPTLIDPSRYGLNEPDPEQQFTEEELAQLAELGMYDERQAANARQMARAAKLREGVEGGSRGTYGRWNIPNPYNPWGDIAREIGANIGERRAEKKAKTEADKAKEALKLYERRTRSPRGEFDMQNAQSIEKIAPPPQYDLGEQTPWEKIKAAGRRFF